MKVISILREVYNPWERRAPFSPSHVAEIIKKYGSDNIKVIVRPSMRRCYSNKEYEKAGAVIDENISLSNIVFSVKQVNRRKVLADKTFLFSIIIQSKHRKRIWHCLILS